MKVAVIGAGISGISAAEYLSEHCEVTLFDKEDRVGGHADTQTIEIDGDTINVDTGFIVFNPENYPRFYELINKYNVNYQDSDMSFAVSNRLSGLEYNATSIKQLFCQKKNLLNPKFYRMIMDITRFYREAGELLKPEYPTPEISLGDYLAQNHYGDYFIHEHIIPMASALWSGEADLIMEFPAKYLVSFMNNHKMMQVSERPVWKTITGGSKQYLKAITKQAAFKVRLGAVIKTIKRKDDTVTLVLDSSEERFDAVILACHSDQALKLLEQPSTLEDEVLSAIRYQKNEICLHWDERCLPKNRQAWASWNVIKDGKHTDKCTVSYYMNLLQSLPTEIPVIVSLNMNEDIDPSKVWKYIEYDHPVYTQATIDAQRKRSLIQGQNNTYFCGAYWGWGFHEDGARSGLEAAKELLSSINHVTE
ncbi:NAD(P)/FAD-dependent oxidoreductase [Kangiella sediminilitoris]|uniref:Dehydrogenase n=1 Tax=Kangiella sediminilitoris TaxID=1144748 RepID=A0A1B3B884_9GAMM|nr:FAD-dependent oxidoreductase [Kangiella sediminilitoris]AOE48966.1 dehydrogenase [Kangiella sediminilitoris]